MIRLLAVLLVIVGITPSSPVRADTIPPLTYHITPPYIVDTAKRIGLTYEMADRLGRRSNGRYHFTVKVLSRPKLNAALSGSEGAVVPWSNPDWFTHMAGDKLLWSDGYAADSNAVLSSTKNPVEYDGPKSLAGLTVIGLHGNKWTDLEYLVTAGTITRIDTETYWLAMRAVLKGRVDVALVPSSIAKFLIARNLKTGKFHISMKPHSAYARHFLVDGDTDLLAYLQTQVSYFRDSSEWKAVMAQYGL